MEGDIADLQGILKLAKPYGARTYVDEAHGIGVLGATGAGAAEHLGVLDDVDIVMGTSANRWPPSAASSPASAQSSII